ncbi:LamG-like jellyroll fold domain-containing protein [Motiliproteus sp. MSK22-1]|uniref:LamG-like jellyroll fold domain-containing protein n=1 Tax=Motiliproteus sp. MSK22-1 TaxID=1897630 RepID=UPI00097673CE|nr:LamG-like jellyroll fold domain-containing protein [Motiliproteus sp. MSK22-1]OMH38247.1 hypothetical protein BGP75_08335 [Motiliproteus sp. MSK22-1]
MQRNRLAVHFVLLVSAFLSTFANAESVATLPQDYIAHWSGHIESDVLVEDTGNYPGTAAGVTQIVGHIGQGLSFDGVDDGVLMSSALPPSGATTISFFALVNAGERISLGNSASSTDKVLGIYSNPADGSLTVEIESSGNNWSMVTPAEVLTNGIWNHIAVTVSSDLLISIYVNGIFVSSATAPAQPTARSSFSLMSGFDGYSQGSLDGIYVYSRDLLSQEIKALALEQSVIPTDNLEVAYDFAGMSGGFLPDSSAGADGSYDATVIKFTKGGGKHGISGKAGIGGYAYASEANLNHANFTVSIPFKRNALTATPQGFFSRGGNNTLAPWALSLDGEQNRLYFLMSEAGTKWDTLINPTTTITDTNWHVITGVKDGATAILYLDGVEIGSAAAPAGALWDTPIGVSIGAERHTTTQEIGRHLDGELGTARYYSYAMSPREVALLATERAVRPTAGLISEYTMDSNEGSTLVDAMDANNGDLLGATSVQGAIGSGLKFDLNTGGITVPHNEKLNFDGDYAYAAFASWTNTEYGLLFGKFNPDFPFEGPTAFTNYRLDQPETGRITFRESNTVGYMLASSTTDLNDGKLRHFVFQRKGNKLQIYIDGILDAEMTLASVKSFTDTSPFYMMGQVSIQKVGGVLDEVQVYAGRSLEPLEILSLSQRRDSVQLDTPAPKITQLTTGAGLISDLIVDFNTPIEEATFKPEDVTLVGDNFGPVTISNIEVINNQSFRVIFDAPLVEDNYSIQIGPDITGIDGKGMDQDESGGASNNVFQQPLDIAPLSGGYLINLISTSGTGNPGANDITQTDIEGWNDNYGATSQIAVTKATTGGTSIHQTGVVDWFEPDRTFYFDNEQRNAASDYATSTIDYLDSAGNIVFWTKTFSYGNYGSHMTYGTSQDHSGGKNPGHTRSHPKINGELKFISSTNTVKFSHIEVEPGNFDHGQVNSWELTEVDVDSIRKIRLTDSNVQSTYTIGARSSYVRLKLLPVELPAPKVNQIISGAGLISNLVVEFNTPIDEASFKPEDVTLVGDNSGPVTISNIEVINNQSFRVIFDAPLVEDNYSIQIGPDITGTNGKGMDQDENAGELNDVFQQQLDIVAPVPVTDPAHPDLVVMYTMDDISGSVVPDSSSNGNSATLVGAATVISGGVLGSSAVTISTSDTDGEDGIIRDTVDQIDFSQGLTLSTWIKRPAAWDPSQHIYTMIAGSGDPYSRPENSFYLLAYQRNIGSEIRFEFVIEGEGDQTASVAFITTDVNFLIDDQFHNIVVTYNGGNFASDSRMYIDGAEVASTLSAPALTFGAVTNKIGIGYNPNTTNASRPWYGEIDQFRLINSELNASQVSNLYSEVIAQDITSPTHSHLMAMYTGDNINGSALVDESIHGHDGSVSNITQTTGVSGNALSFNGTSSLVNLDAPSGLINLGDNNDFAISGFIKPRFVEGVYPKIISARGNSNNQRYEVNISPTGELAYDAFIPAGGAARSSILLQENQWQFFAVSYDASENLVTVRIDDQEEQIPYTETYDGGAPTVVHIGATFAGTSLTNHLNADLDNLRIFDTALSSADLDDLQAEISIDNLPAPKVTNVSTGAGLISDLVVEFNTPIDEATFKPEDVTLVGDNFGSVTISTIEVINSQSFRVIFDAPLVEDNYSIQIGPDITGTNGQEMDQDESNGEANDVFQGQLDIAAPQQIPTDNLAVYLDFADISGTSLPDTAPGASGIYDGTVVGSVTKTVMQAGVAANFDKANQERVDLPPLPGQDGDLTISFHINMTADNANMAAMLFTNRETSDYQAPMIIAMDDRSSQARTRALAVTLGSSGDSISYLVVDEAIEWGRDHHIAVVISGSSVKIFVDGIEKASGVHSGTRYSNSAPTRLMGKYGTNYSDYYTDGSMAKFRYYTRGLTEDEIVALSQEVPSITDPAHPDLVAMYTMDNILGSTILDESLNGHDASIIGGSTSISGVVDAAIHFNGIDQFAFVPGDNLLTGSFTMATWVQVKEGQVANLRQGGNGSGWSNTLIVSNRGVESAVVTSSPIENINTSYTFPTPLADDTWVFAVLRYESGSGIDISYNDQYSIRTVSSNNTGLRSSSDGFLLGGDRDNTFVESRQDQIRFFNRYLTDAELSSLYREGSSLAAQYKVPNNDVVGAISDPSDYLYDSIRGYYKENNTWDDYEVVIIPDINKVKSISANFTEYYDSPRSSLGQNVLKIILSDSSVINLGTIDSHEHGPTGQTIYKGDDGLEFLVTRNVINETYTYTIPDGLSVTEVQIVSNTYQSYPGSVRGIKDITANYLSNILDTNHPHLVAMYTGDNVIDSTLVDESIHGHDGTVSNITQTTGVSGNGLSFNGISSLIDLDGPGGLINLGDGNDFAMSGFIRPRFSEGVYPKIISARGNSNNQRYEVNISPTGELAYDAFIPAGGAARSSILLQENQWQFFAVSYDASENLVTVRIDDQEEQIPYTETYDGGAPSVVHIGATDVGTSLTNHLNADLDNLRIFDTALSSADMDDLQAEISIDNLPAPKVTNITTGAGLISDLVVEFNTPIDEATFNPEDVTLVGDNSGPVTISRIEVINSQSFRVIFESPLVEDNYSIQIGPNITGTSGKEMDQDESNGEANDVFQGQLNIAAPQQIPTDNLAVYLDFADISGTSLPDTAPGASGIYDGIVVGSVTKTVMQAGVAANFDKANQERVDLPPLPGQDGDLTISFHINLTAGNTNALAILLSSRIKSDIDAPMVIAIDDRSSRSRTKSLVVTLGSSGDSVSYLVVDEAIEWGRDHHITVVISGSSVKIFVDGIEKASGVHSGTRYSNSAPTRLMGKYATNYSDYYTDGSMAKFRYYTRGLTEDEIVALSKEVSRITDPAHPSLVAMYTGDNVNGTTLVDDSVNELDGTMSNITQTTGVSGKALLFNGSNGSVNLGAPSKLLSLGDNNDFAMSGFIKPVFNGAWAKLVAARGSSTNEKFEINISPTGQVAYGAFPPSGGAAAATTKLKDNVWQFFAVSYDASEDLVTFRIGDKEETIPYLETYSGGVPTVVHLGAALVSSSPEYHLNAELDNIRIFDTALSSADMTDLQAEISIDNLPAPKVTQITTGAGLISNLVVEFNTPIDEATFEPEDVTLVGNSFGSVTISRIEVIDSQSFRIIFDAALVEDNYSIQIGPNITGTNGKEMDQDESGGAANDVFQQQLDIAPLTGGYLINLFATSGSTDPGSNDINQTSADGWEDSYGATAQIAVTKATTGGVSINHSGVVDWFDPSRILYLDSRESNWGPDSAASTIDYLDSNGNIVFWTKTFSYGQYGSNMSFGTSQDHSNGTNRGHTGIYPKIRGKLIFDQHANTVSFTKHENGSGGRVNSWELTDVDVSSIRKIRLTDSSVQSTYTSYGSAYVRLKLLPIAPKVTKITTDIGLISDLIVDFNTPIEEASFEPEDVTLLGDNFGPVTISRIEVINSKSFRVIFDAPLVEDIYSIQIGPNITGTNGKGMDQDESGWVANDVFLGQIEVVAPISLTDTSHPDLLAFYTMDNIVGTTLFDESPNGHDATIVGGPSSVQGVVDNAILFNGLDQHATVPGNNLLTGAFTIATWVKVKEGEIVRINQGRDGHGSGWSVAFTVHNKGVFGSIVSSSPVAQVSTGYSFPAALPDDTWVFAVFRYEPGVGIDVSYNGQNGVSSETFSNTGLRSSSYGLVVGGSDHVGNLVKGRQDQTRLFNRYLTDAELSVLHNEVTLDLVPKVNQLITAPGLISNLTVEFNVAIDAATFGTDDVSIDGNISGLVAVADAVPIDDFRFRIDFASPLAEDSYSVQIGPEIRDTYGRVMDQYENGGSENDAFVGQIDIVPLAPLTDAAHPDLLAFYTMDNIVGTTLFDESPNGHDATIVGGPSSVQGVVDNAILFNGLDQHATVPGNNLLTGAFTIATWVKVKEGEIVRINQGRDGHGSGWSVAFTVHNKGVFGSIVSSSPVAQVSTGYSFPAALPDDTWVFAVFRYEPGVGIDVSYNSQNGVSSETFSNTGLRSSSYGLVVGGSDHVGNLVKGRQDQTRLFNRYLTDAELGILHNEVILKLAPKVNQITTEPGLISNLTVEFNVAIDTSTFAPDDVIIEGNNTGPVTIADVQSIDGYRFRVDFSVPLEEDTYSVQIGPIIFGTNGRGMDQDEDGIEQEVDDYYQTQFSVDVSKPSAPTVNFPVVPVINTTNQLSVEISGDRDADSTILITGTENVSLEVSLGSDPWVVQVPLVEGLSTFNIVSADAAGNQSEAVQLQFNADSIKPLVTAASPVGLSNQTPGQFTFTVQEDGSGIDLVNSSIAVTRNGVSQSGTLTQETNQVIFTPAVQMLQGVYLMTPSLVDHAGNRSVTTEYNFTLDYEAPTPLTVDDYPSATSINVHTLTGTKEAGTGVWIDGELAVAISADTTWSYQVNLIEGDNSFELQPRDGAGNPGDTLLVQIRYGNTAPGAVTFAVADEGDGTTLTLDWQAYDEVANGNNIAEYRVYTSTGSFTDVGALTPVAVVPGGQKQATLTGLNRAELLYLAVVAVDSQELFLSEVTPTTATPVDIVPPGAASNLQVTPTATSLTVSWHAPATQVVDLKGYRLTVDDGVAPNTIEILASSLSDPLDPVIHLLDSLAPAASFQISVVAYDGDNNESPAVSLGAATLLANPANPSLVELSSQVELTWDVVTPWSLLKEYAIYVESASFTSVEGLEPRLKVAKGASDGITLTQSIAGLENGTTYYVAVTAINISEGETPEVTALAATPTSDADGPEVTTISYRTSALTQDMTLTPTLAHSGSVDVVASDLSAISRVEFYLADTLLGTDFAPDGNDRYSQALDLVSLEDANHTLTIKLYDTWENHNEQSYDFSVAIAAPAAPVLVTPASGYLTNDATLRIEGTALTGTQVQLYRNDQPVGNPLVVNSQGQFSQIVTLEEGDNHYTAAAEFPERGGLGALSGIVTVTLNTAIPNAPGGFKAISGEMGQVFLSWSPVTSSDPENQIKGYQLYRSSAAFSAIDDPGVDPVNSALLTNNEFADMPVPDGTYYYRVATSNQIGTPSALSEQVVAEADSVGPRAESITYVSLGNYDEANQRFGLGGVQVTVRFDEPLRNDPYLSIVPAGGLPITLDLSKDYNDDLRYTGSFNIDSSTISGTAYAVLSSYDNAGNRGTEIDEGATLLVDTLGPEVTKLGLNPVSPLKVDESNGLWVEVLLNLADEVSALSTPTLIPMVDGVIVAEYSAGIALSRDSQSIQGTPLWVGGFQLPNSAGQDGSGNPIAANLSFQYSAVDDLGNQTDRIQGQTLFQLYQGDLPPLAAPRALTAKAIKDGGVELNWEAVENAVGYLLYRQAPGENELSQWQSLSTTSFTDTTHTDGDYAYAVTSLRRENGQETISALSDVLQVSADRTAPDAPTNTQLVLNGAGIVVTWVAPVLDAEGQVQDLEGLTYNLYRLPLGEGEQASQQTLNDTTPIQTGIPEPIALDSTPSEAEHSYVLTAVDAAGNESSPGQTVYLNFGLLPVSGLNVTLNAEGFPELSWSHQGAAIKGYHIYYDDGQEGEAQNLIPLTQALIPHQGNPTTFTDSAYNGGETSDGAAIQRRYTVVAVDDFDVQSVGHSLVLPALSVHLDEPENGDPVMYRGVMNELRFRVENRGSLPATSLILEAIVDDNGTQRVHQSERFDVEGSAIAPVSVIVGGYEKLDVYSQLQLRIKQQPFAGENITIGQNKEVAVGDKALFATVNLEAFTRGSTGLASFTLDNTSDVDTEVVLARSNGNSVSDEVRFILEDLDGNVLAVQEVQQFSGGVINVSNGAMVARLAPGESFTSELFQIPVPEASPDQVLLRLEIDHFHYQIGRGTHVAIEGTGSRHQVPLADLSYKANIADISPSLLYGEGEVSITGQAVDSETEAPMAGVPISLVTEVRGFEQLVTVFTDGLGNFSHTYNPQGNSGTYAVSAIHPDSITRPAQAEFVVQNAVVSPGSINIRIPRNYTQPVSIKVKSGYATSLSNVRLKQILAPTDDPQSEPSLPAGVTLNTGVPANIAANQTGYLNVHFSANNSSAESGNLHFEVIADGSQGGEQKLATLVMSYNLSEALPALKASPAYVDTGVGLDKAITETVTLSNTGLDTLQNPQLTLTDANGNPAPSWAFISSNSQPGDLLVGESQAVQVSFNPSASVPQDNYEFRLKVTGDNISPYQVQYFVAVVSSEVGNAFFHVSDIYTATPDENHRPIPGLEGAKIEIQNEKILKIDSAHSDANGEVFFGNLPAGTYSYRVSAFDHDSVSGRIQVKPGITVSEDPFLMNTLVTVEWEVKEITIEDKYEIIVQATFETNVPVAVVVANPLSINLPVMEAGDLFYGELTLTNHGLIRAETMTADLPTGNEFISMEYLAEIPDTLGPGDVFILPYRVQALNDFNPTLDGDATGGGCGDFQLDGRITYTSVCTNGSLVNGQSTVVWASSWESSSCGNGNSGGAGGGGGSSYRYGNGGGGRSIIDRNYSSFDEEDEGLFCAPLPSCPTGDCNSNTGTGTGQ